MRDGHGEGDHQRRELIFSMAPQAAPSPERPALPAFFIVLRSVGSRCWGRPDSERRDRSALPNLDPCRPTIDIGVARPSAHGQATISTATALAGSAALARSLGPTAPPGNSPGFTRGCGHVPRARTLSLSLLPPVSRMRAPDLPGTSLPRFTAPNRPLTEAKRVRTLRYARASRASRSGAKRQTES